MILLSKEGTNPQAGSRKVSVQKECTARKVSVERISAKGGSLRETADGKRKSGEGKIMIRFNNDYNRSAHPAVLEALMKSSGESYGGYGLDFWCEKAAEEIGKYIGTEEADIHFLVGGTQANFTVITAALRSYQSVISADTGHIQGHETGAVENTGHKIIALPSADGKITAAQVREQAELYLGSGIKEHITQPKMVYLSFPTEFGTVYSKAELEEISGVCRRYGLFLFIDGARLGYGLGASEADVTMEDIARLADVFYCGGTKCGALFGEAVVIINPVLKTDFRSYIKQNGGMLAKGWLLGIQFYTLFRDGLYFKITQEADRQAMRIRQAFRQKGIPFFVESPTNQQFVVVKNSVAEKLAEKYIYEFEQKIDEDHCCIRFCTSWSTPEEDVEALIRDIADL